MEKDFKKILITGATGYIGSNLTRKLVSLGYKVNIILRPTSDIFLIDDIKEKVELHYYNGDSMEMFEIIKKISPDIVIHLASLFVGEHKTNQINDLINSNVLFGTQLLEASVNSGVKYFINTGTHWQNYNDEKYNPVNLYAATKEALETISKYYLECYDIRMLTLKIIDTYGPNDPRPKVMNLLKRIANSNEKLEMSKGEQELGLLYIDDVVQAFLLAIENIKQMNPHESDVFLALPNEVNTLREIAYTFEGVSGKPLNIEWGKRPYKNREMMKVYTKEKNIVEGFNTTPLKKGIEYILERDI